MLKLYNTLSRSKEDFRPRVPGEVSLYTCGPTVYDTQHIGNLRTAVFADTLKRWLAYGESYDVTHVVNITDVEDKIINRSGVATVPEMQAWTKQFEDKYYSDLAALRVEPADKYPHATDFIPQMIAFIEKIVAADLAYVSDGSVYLNVRRYNDQYGYGKLLRVDFAGFAGNHRIDNDEYDKENAQDFALWKAESQDKPGWESPWGYGRPGWHLECSVMVKEELGLTIDIHTGAVDLIFPHHENEITQSQAANGEPLANFWVHAEHLLVDSAKMAKSAGNFYTLDDVTKKGFAPAVLRLLYLQAHYRSKLNFTWESLKAAVAGYERIQQTLRRLQERTTLLPPDTGRFFEVGQVRLDFNQAMDDDLSTPEALAVIYELLKNVNAALDADELTETQREDLRTFFHYAHRVLGVFELEERVIPDTVQQLVEQRENARKDKDFSAADRLRDELAALGWDVEDTAQGQRLRKR